MVVRPLRTLTLALAVLVAPMGTSAQSHAALPDGVHARAAVRPPIVRVGEVFELSVQLRGPASSLIQVEEVTGSFEIVDVTERQSVTAGPGGRQDLIREVVFHLRAEQVGEISLTPLRIWVDDQAFDQPGPTVRVQAAAIAWQRGERRSAARPETPVLPGGRPPALGGEDSRIPGGRPGGGIVATVPGGVRPIEGGVIGSGGLGGIASGGWSGGLPYPGNVVSGAVGGGDGFDAGVVGGWAEIAANDPWWEEMIPRIGGWDSTVSDASGWIEFRAGVGPRPVYVGQQLTYLATAGFTPEAGLRMRADPEYRPPAPSDVWRVDVPRIGLGYLGASEGEIQDVRPFVQAFFPLRSGTLRIPQAELLYTLGGGGRLGPLDTLRTAPIDVEVLPIPTAGAPTGWDGAVGRYRVDVSLDRAVLAPGETALLTLYVRGAGNVEGLSSPQPTNLRGVVLRPAGERAVVEVRDGVVGGVKVFQWFVTLATPGRVSVGPFLFHFFDPWAGTFETAATAEVTLEGIG